jgi:hypothetical protein
MHAYTITLNVCFFARKFTMNEQAVLLKNENVNLCFQLINRIFTVLPSEQNARTNESD